MFYNLALSGGATRTATFVGCVKSLEEKGYLKSFKNFVGTSAGAVIALMLVLDYNYDEMKNFLKIKLSHSAVTKISMKNIINIFETFGIDNGDNLTDFLKHIIINKDLDENITFLELTKKKGKNLVICVCNISKKQLEYLSVDTHPDMKVVTAIRMAASIPLLYQPVIYNNDYYIDSFVYNNFPIEFFNKHVNETLGINVYDHTPDIKTFWDFLQSIYNSMLERLYIKQKTEHKHICNIELYNKDNFDLANLKFKFDETIFEEYIEIGYNKMNELITQLI
jgi:predicted acylesterase/phospholipase RssA